MDYFDGKLLRSAFCGCTVAPDVEHLKIPAHGGWPHCDLWMKPARV